MSDKKKNEEVARLEQMNGELTDSLRRCRKLLHDYEVRLAANSNEQDSLDDDGDGEANQKA